MKFINKNFNIFKTNFTLVFLSIFIGIIISIVAQYFIFFSKKIIYLLKNTNLDNILNYNFENYQINLVPFVSCVFASIVICIIIKLTKIERWYGPADTIYASHLNSEKLDVNKGFLSSAASFISISGGASVGLYGPLVHFGGTLAIFIKRFKFIPLIPHDILIGSGVAAAISAGFCSPIAGIIFAHEVVLRHFSMRAVTAISLASVSASLTAIEMKLVSPFLNFNYEQFNSTDAIPGLFIVGIFASLVAITFMKSLIISSKIAQFSKIPFHYRPLIPGILCGIAGIFIPETIGLGSETILNIFKNLNSLQFLFLILLLKIILTSSCIGFGLFGGVLSPALLLGTCSGAIIFYFPILGTDPSLFIIFAVSGMAAVSSSVIGAPLTAIILVLELTGSYEYAIASILPIGLSSLITYLTFGSSFFDKQLLIRNIPISDGRYNDRYPSGTKFGGNSNPQPSTTSYSNPPVFINPEIVEENGKECVFSEGCLSIPGIREDVKRKNYISIKFQDLNGKFIKESFSGIAARVIQHEYDHIEGILFTDKLSYLKKKTIKRRLKEISTGKIKVDYSMKFL